jgi:erythromycin esterase-like protein
MAHTRSVRHRGIRRPLASDPAELIRQHARPLLGAAGDFDPLLDLIGGARFVLLGEASHGTHEFYRARAEITRRLIAEKGFTAVAVEGDWPDAYRVNRFVRAASADADAEEALSGFKRFPTWMWRNADVLDFVGWLREFNDSREPSERAGFYGLDLYSLFGSIEAVLGYLGRVDPAAAERARYRYSCFDHAREDAQAYGYAASFDLTRSCEKDVVAQLVELRRNATAYGRLDGALAADELFAAEQNARVVQNAEQYYRMMFQERVSTWNLRDSHMVETLEKLATHLSRQRGASKIVVWAHNSHLGDASATEMGWDGELNVGQLVREQYGEQAVLVGFSTHAGTVTAASAWDGLPERKRVQESHPDSYERLLHDAGIENIYLRLRDSAALGDALREPLLVRAIGVIYRPETERASHYFHARLSDQFDAMIHFDHTRAVEPLERTTEWPPAEEPPETFPSGI